MLEEELLAAHGDALDHLTKSVNALDTVWEDDRSVAGIKIAAVEKKYAARYVGYYSLPTSDGPWLVFYRDELTPREIELRYDNYFGIKRQAISPGADGVWITNAKSIRGAEFRAIEQTDGTFLVSRSVHDCVGDFGGAFLDGGPFYTRYNPNFPPTHVMTIVGGREVFTPNDVYQNKVVKPALVAKASKPAFRANGVSLILSDVAEFHDACDQPVLTKPTIPAADRVKLRLALIKEEWEELQKAVAEDDLVEIADAMGDIMYVVAGMALEFGIPLDRVWAEVQRSNMLKVDPIKKKVKKFPNGKVMKPDGWLPPNIKEAIYPE